MTNLDEPTRRLIEIERSKRVLAEAREMLTNDPRSPFLQLVVHVMAGRIERISQANASFESNTVGGGRFRAQATAPEPVPEPITKFDRSADGEEPINA